MAERYGKKIRALRQRANLTQAVLADRLAISASYLNLLENDRRPLTTELLLKLAQQFEIDLRTFSGESESHLISDLAEVFGDGVFENHPFTRRDIADLVTTHPDIARAVLHLHQEYTHARTSADTLAQRVLEDQDTLNAAERVRLSSEQISDLLQRHLNYFPDLEAAAEATWERAKLDRSDLYAGLVQYLTREYGVTVHIAPPEEMGEMVRRYDARRKELHISEVLRGRSRTFQVAGQLGLLACRDSIASLLADAQIDSPDAVALGHVVLTDYFAAAVVMPYVPFLRAAEELRYDVELLGQRFGTGFEQTCHRLTTLRRPNMSGVQFYLLRVDMAGNISKKFSAAGIRFPRFSGLCALWNVHAAFLQPGVVRVQLSKQMDGTTVFAIARTVRRHRGTYHSPTILYSVGIGCDLSDAHRLVYSDGIDLTNPALPVPIGITCRLCERTSCQARAFPSVQRPLRIDENVRNVSFYAPSEG